ncbi:MAG: hypothetical protein J6K55_00120 [Clostridia bacterium]|nr:hypothetical protein [Clostridia bacterium]
MENTYKESGMREVFCRFIRRNGRIIYPKNARYFHFWVRDDRPKESEFEQLTLFDMED